METPKSFSYIQIANKTVLILRWKKTADMNTFLNPISNRIDGVLKYPRQGHNFPFSILIEKERKMFPKSVWNEAFPNSSWHYCVSVSNQTAKASMQHELCHARFFLDTDYRNRITEQFNSLSNKDYVISVLKALGYKQEVWIDEWQAYFHSGDAHLFEK